MEETELTVRLARAGDVVSLVELRLANAEAHLSLDPGTYRLPQREAVARYFAGVLDGDGEQGAVFVAEALDGRVVGMVEVLRRPGPPDHQILPPMPSAEVHTVVFDDVRSTGIGSALLGAAERWSKDHGIGYLSAGIHHANTGAVRFYGRNGYADAGLSLGKRLS